jgi:cell wall-associated NlpC family hydrolase
MKFQGIPYIWAGSNPKIGFDCSGFIVWILQVFNILPPGDWGSAALYDKLTVTESPIAGDLVFYGKNNVTHVMMLIENGLCIGASGGDSSTTTEDIAKTKNAMVKIKRVGYRSDLLGYRSIT